MMAMGCTKNTAKKSAVNPKTRYEKERDMPPGHPALRKMTTVATMSRRSDGANGHDGDRPVLRGISLAR